MSERIETGKGWSMHLADAFEVLACMGDRLVDHVITDPPYEAEAHTKQRRVKRGAKGVAKVEALSFPPITSAERALAGRELARISKRWSLVFCQVEAVHKWRASLEADGLAKYLRTCIWYKPDGQPQLTGDRPGTGYESIVTVHATTKGRTRWNGGGKIGVFVHSARWSGGTAHEHPTEKPLDLMLDLVDKFTDPGESILDPFAGSGTTGVAALRRGRTFVGVEKDPKFFDLAVERLRAEERGHTLKDARAYKRAKLEQVGLAFERGALALAPDLDLRLSTMAPRAWGNPK